MRKYTLFLSFPYFQCASLASEFGIRGAATIEEVVNSVLDAYPSNYTKSSLSHALDILITRNLERMGMVKVDEGDFPIGNGYYMNDFIMGMDM